MCSRKMSFGNLFNSTAMNSATEPTYFTSQPGAFRSKPLFGYRPISASALIAFEESTELASVLSPEEGVSFLSPEEELTGNPAANSAACLSTSRWHLVRTCELLCSPTKAK